jgi:hypothetical protein
MKLFFEKNDEQPRKKLGCFGKTLIGVVIYFLVCGLLGVVMGDAFSTPSTTLEDNTIYRIDLEGELVEQATEPNPFDALLPEVYGKKLTTKVGLHDLLNNIALAKNNDKILGIYLKGGNLTDFLLSRLRINLFAVLEAFFGRFSNGIYNKGVFYFAFFKTLGKLIFKTASHENSGKNCKYCQNKNSIYYVKSLFVFACHQFEPPCDCCWDLSCCSHFCDCWAVRGSILMQYPLFIKLGVLKLIREPTTTLEPATEYSPFWLISKGPLMVTLRFTWSG